MQPKRHKSKAKPALALLAVIVIGGAVALMMVDIPAPQTAIEKDLDAKALLAKPQ